MTKDKLIRSLSALAVIIILSALAARLFGGGETLKEYEEKRQNASVTVSETLQSDSPSK
ncbi:MAG: hypothetical protein IJT00_01595 [Lachnospiraceae bacterium]|nr:hypothetical protein [Lachnospiraceae bacterium]